MTGLRTACSRAGGSQESRVRCFVALGSRLRGSTAALSSSLALTGCATQVSSAVSTSAASPGFLLGLWHGFIFPVAWVLSLFMPDVAVYAVPNNGGWYDFGYFLGIVVFGVGARKSRTVYVTRRVRG